MQKLSLKLKQLNDRTKLIVSASATGALLLLAMLLPLSFRSSPAEELPSPPGQEARAMLFSSYWNGAEEDRPAAEKLSDPGAAEEACLARMQALTAYCIDDKALDYSGPTGSEYTVLSSPEGWEMQICRMWLEAKGDWQNWLDVCFDADSGEIYYLYLSRACLAHPENYPIGEEQTPSAEQIAALLAEENGGTLRLYTGEEQKGTAVISCGSGTVCYDIGCTYYDRLIDVKVNCS